MYQKAKRMFSFDINRKINSHSLPKSVRRKEKAVICAEDSQDTPLRFSYVRASNSLRRYGTKSRRAFSASDGSLGSSREDLLDPPVILSRKKRLNVSKQSSKKYKSGNSSSEDLLYDESDCTEDPLSSGMPETDGSVFSSQENLFEPVTRCSANVSKFLRRQSSGKNSNVSGIQASHRSPSPQILESSVELHQSPEEGKHGMDNSTPVSPSNEEKENYSNSDHQEELQPSSPAGDASLSERSLCTISQSVLSDKAWPVRHRVQMAVVRTIHRLVNHINNVKEQVEVLENKCSLLKETLYNLQQDNDALEVKISRLEKQSKESAEEYSDSKDHEYKNYNSNPKEGVTEECLPSVEQIHGDSTDDKASEGTTSCPISEIVTAVTTTDSESQDNRANLTSASSTAKGNSVKVNQNLTKLSLALCVETKNMKNICY